ncbi:hypothetical protein AB0E10_13180 [Streptomyces sp. NPDC048045]
MGKAQAAQHLGNGTGEIADITYLRERLRMERPRLTGPAPW